jgi:hypothetical protein
MNIKYVAKNPTPVAQTITLRQGLPLGDSGVCSTEPVTVQVPPMSVREILFNENGVPLIEGCVQDLTVPIENEDGTPIDPHSTRRERTVIQDVSGNRSELFVAQARRVYPSLIVEDAQNLGGTQLLAQFSHLRSARDNTTAIYSPAALNMTFESRVDSVYHAARTGQIQIDSITGNGFNSADALQMEITNSSSNPVRIVVPQGTMFEQQNWNGNQNLVVKEDVWIDIQPGQSGTFPLPAFCANSSGGSPNRDPMNLTPFVFHDMGESFRDQQSMWRTTDSQRNVRMR